MPERWFHIQPLDPLLIRDARPFQSVPGIRARSLNDVPPSVVAGTLRTALAKKRQSIKHTTPLSYYAKSLVRGPLYRWHDHLYVPMPNDLELFDDEYGMNQVRPKPMMSEGQGFLVQEKQAVLVRHYGRQLELVLVKNEIAACFCITKVDGELADRRSE